ncbi:MAG TPA: DAK2 domain-containing protein [Candidatus Acidoferrales bacterium]|nr:DAK2 domain-containing protein [Candidatus Acidoferrales bacterium]
MDVTSLDGRAYAKFLAAGTYFLRKYRAVLNDLNVFPVPDGDTGTNMYLTVRSAMLEAGKVRGGGLAEVAAAAAQGSLMGARGNSGVIISQMLRGFAHHVRHRSEIDTFMLATAMRESVAAARQALLRPVEGTILSVAEAAAEAAYKSALHERDFYRLGTGIVRAANEALDRTPEQLPVLKEAGVVDSGGAGFVYFVEGILRFLPESRTRTTAFPRRPERQSVFTPAQQVGENKFCTEFLLQDASLGTHELRKLLEPRGESLLVIGAPPTIKVHIHTDDPDRVQALAGRHGRLTRVKVDNMERQHQLLVVEPPEVTRSTVAVVPGPGFERIVRELGAEVVVNGERNPSVRDLLLAVNKTLGSDVYLFVNDKNVALAAGQLQAMTEKRVHVLPTANIVEGIAGLFAMRSAGDAPPSDTALMSAIQSARSAQLFFAGKDAELGGVRVERGKPAANLGGRLVSAPTLSQTAVEVLREMGAGAGGLITLYYGGAQREKDAQRLSEELYSVYPDTDVEYYYGGTKNAEYWISFDE